MDDYVHVRQILPHPSVSRRGGGVDRAADKGGHVARMSDYRASHSNKEGNRSSEQRQQSLNRLNTKARYNSVSWL